MKLPGFSRTNPLHSSRGQAKGPSFASARWPSRWFHSASVRVYFFPQKMQGSGLLRECRRPETVTVLRAGMGGCPAPVSSALYGGGGEPGGISGARGLGVLWCGSVSFGAMGCLETIGKTACDDGIRTGFSRGSGWARLRGSCMKAYATMALMASTFLLTMSSSVRSSSMSPWMSARTRRSGRLCSGPGYPCPFPTRRMILGLGAGFSALYVKNDLRCRPHTLRR